MFWLVAYLLAGAVVFFGLRTTFKKLKLDPKPHDRIWMHWLVSPEGWLFAIPCWPFLAAASLGWLGADLLHATGKKELRKREEIESARDKKYDHLTLDEKIQLLEKEARKPK